MEQPAEQSKTREKCSEEEKARLYAFAEALYWDVIETLKRDPKFKMEIEKLSEKMRNSGASVQRKK